ncbi:MAG: hypothetical protein PHX83_16895 [Acidobacteriia bacterium]|nr:hypothetical protein [Terriglobia bacterium]
MIEVPDIDQYPEQFAVQFKTPSSGGSGTSLCSEEMSQNVHEGLSRYLSPFFDSSAALRRSRYE